MAWTKETRNRRSVAYETITLGNVSTVYSSEIDWILPGQDFVVIGNTGAVNTVGANTTEVQVSHDGGTTWATITSSFMADFDTATLASFYDNSATGDMPSYRLAITAAGNDAANSAEMVVIVQPV